MEENIEEIKKRQNRERDECSKDILTSPDGKKIIIAGPGTGKTFIFDELLNQKKSKNNLAMTFIRKLTSEIEEKLGDKAEVKTFHAYCKKILYEYYRKNEHFVPYLSEIIEEDARIFKKNLYGFDSKFQNLKDQSPEIEFYLNRGSYYKSVGFVDSVYRVFKLAQKNDKILPKFTQILIDEFQDFNLLEVAFINELEKKGNILIVGDDDQAIYDGRDSSPRYIREKYNSGEYTRFKLPFCSRCTEPIVESVNSIVREAQRIGKLQQRIPDKRFECFLLDKEKDNKKYGFIVTAQCSMISTVAQFIDKEISKINPLEVKDSNDEKKGYPTILIIGQRQYLKKVQSILSKKYKRIEFQGSESKSEKYSPAEGYGMILENKNSNLGWRILVEFFLPGKFERIVKESKNGELIINILDKTQKCRKFVLDQRKIIEYLKNFKKTQKLSVEIRENLKNQLGNFFENIVEKFSPKKNKPTSNFDQEEPLIILTSRKGCKGLSAGFVFILGMNEGEFPRNSQNPSDIEIAEFIVGLSRARKCCYLISNKWLNSPIEKKTKEFQEEKKPSRFIFWIPQKFIQDRGYLKKENII